MNKGEGKSMAKDYIFGEFYRLVEVVAEHDMEIVETDAGTKCLVTLADLWDGSDVFRGVIYILYPEGELISQADWKTPNTDIPEDLTTMAWQHAPTGTPCVIGHDGLPHIAPGNATRTGWRGLEGRRE